MTPRPLHLQLVAVLVLPVAAGIWWPWLAEVGLIANLVLAAVAAADALLTPSPRLISVTREVSDVLSVGARNPVTLSATNLTDNRHQEFVGAPYIGRLVMLRARAEF